MRRLLPSFRWVPVSTFGKRQEAQRGSPPWPYRPDDAGTTGALPVPGRTAGTLERRTPSCSPRRTQADTALTRPPSVGPPATPIPRPPPPTATATSPPPTRQRPRRHPSPALHWASQAREPDSPALCRGPGQRAHPILIPRGGPRPWRSYQQSRAQRCADRRFPRSPLSVRAKLCVLSDGLVQVVQATRTPCSEALVMSPAARSRPSRSAGHDRRCAGRRTPLARDWPPGTFVLPMSRLDTPGSDPRNGS